MFGNSWRVGRILGVELRIDISWAVIALLITYSLYIRLQLIYEGIETAFAVVLAVVSAILFFGSVLVHEYAHALMAKRRGIPVRSITLFLFGGATHAEVEAKGPGAELVIALVGPLTSLALAGVFAIGGIWGDGLLSEEVAGALGYLAVVNLILAVFNLVPGFPLDGGRVLRAIIWGATGSLSRATRWASIAGQAFGYLLVAAGLFFVFNGILGAGIWFAAIGWFLAQAARMGYEQMQARRMLEDVDAEDVMAGDLLSIPQEAMGSLDELVTVSPRTSMADVTAKLEGDSRRVLVVDDGEIVGIITPSDVARWLQRRQAIGR